MMAGRAGAPFQRERASEPVSAGALLVIFWSAFAIAVVAAQALNPALFVRTDPDALMRLVEVRDLLAGQGWFDLTQYRLDPPDGVLMHWSRLVDAPIAGLILIGDIFGIGEAFALAAWPLILLLAFMAGVLSVAMTLGGRAAALPALILPLLFFDPLIAFLPGSIDHHNAQIALVMLAIAAAIRIPGNAGFGFSAGALVALMLAVGLETLPYAAIVGAFVALRWALATTPPHRPRPPHGEVRAPQASSHGNTGARPPILRGSPLSPARRRLAPQDEGGDPGAILFGLALAILPALLHLLTGSPAARFACDALSLAYAPALAVAGTGLAALAILCRTSRPATRLAGLALVGGASVASLLLVAPECRAGPYGALSEEMRTLFLARVTEALPLATALKSDPAGTLATLGPAAVALLAALRNARRAGNAAWLLPAAIMAVALAASLYQVRTLPFAAAAAIPVLAAWLGELPRRAGAAGAPPAPLRGGVAPVRRRRGWGRVAMAAMASLPLTWLAVASLGVWAAGALSDGRIAPPGHMDAPQELTAGLSQAAIDCADAGSAGLLRSVPPGVVLAPVFYGPAVLSLSAHASVAAPYHRAARAVLETFDAFNLPPGRAQEIVARRGVDYVAFCATSRETAIAAGEAPGGLLAAVLGGEVLPWLTPVKSSQPTMLRLFAVDRRT